jgi:hypothetical protein
VVRLPHGRPSRANESAKKRNLIERAKEAARFAAPRFTQSEAIAMMQETSRRFWQRRSAWRRASMPDTRRPPSLARFVEQAMLSRCGMAAPVSTAQMAAEIRSRFPDCEHTDAELATIVASHAIAMGLNVAFDQSANAGPKIPASTRPTPRRA